MRARSLFGAAVVLPWLLACGARTEFESDEVTVSTSSVGGHGGSGGMGGSDVSEGGDCTFGQLGPIATPSDGAGSIVERGVLSTVADAGDTVVLVASYRASVIAPARLRHTAFEPWTNWPADGLLEPGHLVSNTAFTDFAAVRGILGRFGVHYIIPGSGLYAHIDHVAHDPAPSLLNGTIGTNAVRLVASGHGTSLFARQNAAGSYQTAAVLAYQTDTGFAANTPATLGCTSGPPNAAVAGTFDGALVAVHQGTELGIACNATTPPTPFGIQLGRAPVGWGQKLKLGTSMPDEQPQQMHMSSDGKGGAWLFWNTVGPETNLKLARFDEQAKLVGNPIELPDGIDGAWDARVAGNSIWLASLSPNGELLVRRLSSNGQALESAVIEVEEPLVARVNMRVAKDGLQAVVSYHHLSGGLSTVRVARFGCATR